jgi:hypothetical protein
MCRLYELSAFCHKHNAEPTRLISFVALDTVRLDSLALLVASYCEILVVQVNLLFNSKLQVNYFLRREVDQLLRVVALCSVGCYDDSRT